MTDYDRGAYTPQPDGPLQFDARGPRSRKPMPMTLIGSGAVLVVLLGALALHYRHDTKAGGDGARPVGEPLAQFKAAAPASAQPKDPAGGIDVFGGKTQTASQAVAGAPPKSPNFAPPPEAPKPRAQLTVTTEDATTTTRSVPTTATTVATAAPAKTASTYKAPVAATAVPAKPDATAVVAKLAATPVAPKVTTTASLTKSTTVAATSPKPVAATAKPAGTAKAAPAASVGGAMVQIGAFSTTAQSDKGWSDVSTAMAGSMGGKSKRTEAVEVGGKTFIRTAVAGFPTRAAADAFCKTLAAKGHTCFAKGG